MSGGALDYFYFRLEEIADRIAPRYSALENELARMLEDLAVVMRALEWYLSGDESREDFEKAFLKFGNKWSKRLAMVGKLIAKDDGGEQNG